MTFNYKQIGKILKKSSILAFKWNIGKWLSTVGIAILSTFLIPLGKEIYNWELKTALLVSGLILLVIYLIRFILIALKESIKYFHEVYKNANYGEAIILLKNSFAHAHYYRKTPGFQKEDFMKSMILFCNSLKIVFDKITGSDCSVSIKVPIRDTKVQEGTTLKNLTRDQDHQERDTQKYDETKHTIIGNSPFINCLNNVISNKDTKYYINNNVNGTDNYLNTSKVCHPNGILPYSSELVCPITPIISLSTENYDCHGFICVDSNKKNAFTDKYAPAILEGVADGICDLIYELNYNSNGK